ncbi:putative GATA transcription factor 22 [Acorus calamus]|uniref:GATA transcription factor 22 n=1 Tax=Acorus calamus TaxID=4465 RepID=A0AAV9CLV2_ACOCL|nr:putative GATA transcription factor 22 [Acorus calamus]
MKVNKLDPNFLQLSLVPATDDDTKDYNNSNYKSSMIDEDGECSARWMPSKMRFMRKMMNSNNQIKKPTRRNNKALQNQQEPLMPPNEGSNISSRSSNGDPSNSPIRVCSDCQTTKTPLWRSGPCGPKSLCNACGIRQRKARRALAAAAMGGGGLITTEASRKVKKDDMGVNCTLPFKKRCKFMDAARPPKKQQPRRFDEFTIRLSKSSAFHQVFPQDEREAAILLMALSCGLICG